MSTYASTLTAPVEILWVDRYSEWGDDENVITSQVSTHKWDYEAGNFPFKKQYLYFLGEYRYYQAQVRLRRRFVFDDEHDGSWEDWSDWSDSSFNTASGHGSNNANGWNFANVDTLHVNTPYNTYDFGAHQPAYIASTNDLSEYDMVQMEVRIRAYRPSDQRHGAWAYQLLDVWYAPGAELSNAVLLADGSLRFNYSTAWTRNGGKISFKSVTRNGENILQNGDDTTKEMRSARRFQESETSPTPEPVKQVTIPADKIGVDLDVENVIRIEDATFYDTDGASMKVKPVSLTVWPNAKTTDGTPNLALTVSSLRALTVTATKKPTDTYTWEKAECNIKWNAPDGTVKTLQADSITVEAGKATCIFRTPPLDVTLNVSFVAISEANDSTKTNWGRAKAASVVESDSFMTFRVGTHTASLIFDGEWGGDFQQYGEAVEIPGRTRPVSRTAAGGTKGINVAGNAIRRGSVDSNKPSAALTDWIKMENLAFRDGILRIPGGHRFKARLEGLSYAEKAASPLTSVKATFTEVS
ncbi:MAG: hypothetical protein KBT28_12425 [Bacteroidales bacterium]|nr:hypothetical protein [Candidatus Colimorpha merdihippi]